MTSKTPTVLVLGGTGKTGSAVAVQLVKRGDVAVRTAARSGADVPTVPVGDGAEAFVDVADIAAVIAATLADPGAHAGAQYSPTGPEALTMSEVAAIITEVGGEPAKHRDVDREAWIQAILDAGVPSDYADTLRFLTETVAASRGSRPTDDVERVTGRPPATFAHFVRQSQRWGGAR